MSSTVQAIKQLEERKLPVEVAQMVWSDKMDLVALANIKGEVSLHRLNWTKAWILNPPPGVGIIVKAIAWRPDGKIIAIAYSSGKVVLVKVENKDILHTFETKSEVTCMHWPQDKLPIVSKPKSSTTDPEENELNAYMQNIDVSAKFLPNTPASTNDEPLEARNILYNQTTLNILVIGTAEGVVDIRVFGTFPCVSLDLKNTLKVDCSVENVHITESMDKIFISSKDPVSREIKIHVFDSDIFTTHSNELFAIAVKQVKLMSLMNFLMSTITTITESWESILLELDNKLSKYASRVPEGGVTADFLELLMFGVCSEDMKAFLLHDLTKKGLDKFGQSIEMSYFSIKEMLLKCIVNFGQNVTYHLAEMRGMARLEHRYKILGLFESNINEAIQSNGSFLIKRAEIQQIINHSVTNYKAFFRWLYTAIMHLMEETVSVDIPNMAQHDLAYISEFIQNFDHIGKSGFVMERLGQYLTESSLAIQPDMSSNDWTQFLSQNSCMQNDPNILKHHPHMSLLQQFKELQQSVDRIFTEPTEHITQQFNFLGQFDVVPSVASRTKISTINISKDVMLFTFLQDSSNVIQVLQLEMSPKIRRSVSIGDLIMRIANLHFSDDDKNCYKVSDMQVYSSTVLSVLLHDDLNESILCQVPILSALEKFAVVEPGAVIFDDSANVPSINGCGLVPKLVKVIDNMVPRQFAVSGARKVGIVLAENRRKIKLFEMEAEEEEDEDADMTGNTTKDSEMSMVE